MSSWNHLNKKVSEVIMANRGGFSWKRATGVSRAKSNFSRSTGIPTSKSGRQRKVGAAMTSGCFIPVLAVLGLIVLILL